MDFFQHQKIKKEKKITFHRVTKKDTSWISWTYDFMERFRQTYKNLFFRKIKKNKSIFLPKMPKKV